VGFADVTGRERLVLSLLAALMLLFGVLPGLLTPLINPLVTAWAGHLTLP
jgi:NADH:ubiquinone oxidoreductase subunit 4 (subunit M)